MTRVRKPDVRCFMTKSQSCTSRGSWSLLASTGATELEVKLQQFVPSHVNAERNSLKQLPLIETSDWTSSCAAHPCVLLLTVGVQIGEVLYLIDEPKFATTKWSLITNPD